MNLIIRDHPYWVFMDPWISKKEGRFGPEYHEFLSNLKLNEDYVVYPMALMQDSTILQWFLGQLGVDALRLQYKVEHDLFISFRERKMLTAFILKFREGCRLWRED